LEKKISWILIFLLVFWIAFQVNCGSFIGLIAGAIVGPGKMTIPGWKIVQLKPGKKITVFLKEGQSKRGKYWGIRYIPDVKYAEKYAQGRELNQGEIILPALGEKITIQTAKGDRYENILFQGFDIESISVMPVSIARPSTLKLEAIKAIQDHEGNSLDIAKIKDLLAAGKIPCLSTMSSTSAILIISEAKIELIPMNDVFQIEVPRGKGRSIWNGFLIGAGIDVFAWIVFWGPSISKASCPLVYSFDGKNYVLDSETFSGAIFKAAQRTDWDNLDHLEEIKGRYRLKIMNNFQETQYIDEIKLFAVDHPRGSDVVPSFSGKFHSILKPVNLINAVDWAGNNVLELLKEKDEHFWISNPLDRNPELPEQTRDSIIMEFPRPTASSHAKLILTIQNTDWASYMEGHISELPGKELEAWHDLMNRSVEAREAFKKLVIREGMLSLKLWDGEGWKDMDYLWFVGPSISKDQVVELDIRNIPGNVLRVKLESTAGLWMVDSVKADFSADLPIDITEAQLIQAKDNKGKDLSSLLGNIDDQDYILPTNEEWAELTFRAPARKKGYERSFILKSTGYYKVHGDTQSEPQKALMAKLSKPGAFGKYSLELLARYKESALTQIEKK
jgi:hypothetical protein